MSLPPNDPNHRDLDAAGSIPDPEDPTGRSGWVTTKVAAVALKVAPRTVRDYIKSGKLTARSEGEGVKRTSYVSIDSLQELIAQRRRDSGQEGGQAAASPTITESLAAELAAEDHESRGEPAASAADDPEDSLAAQPGEPAAGSAQPRRDELMREAMLRLETRAAEAADLRARLQLTAYAESTLREDLARERERAERLQKELDHERDRARRLEAQPWWKKLFGRLTD